MTFHRTQWFEIEKKNFRTTGTMRIMDLDKLNLVKLAKGGLVFGIFATVSAASKNDAHFKSGQK